MTDDQAHLQSILQRYQMDELTTADVEWLIHRLERAIVVHETVPETNPQLDVPERIAGGPLIVVQNKAQQDDNGVTD